MRRGPNLLAIVLLGAWTGAVCADDNEVLERFLTRLGLVELQALHLEQVLDGMQPGEPRTRTAERLADIYAGQLVENSESKTEYDRVLQRIQRLVERIPESKTASLEVMLLQADYVRAETLMAKWTADRSEEAARDEAARILTSIAPQLETRQEQLRGAVDKLSESLDGIRDEDLYAEKLRELTRLESVAGRASFFAAWSNYYWGLANQPLVATHPGFVKAREIFRRVLGIEGAYGEVQADSLGLESIWRARTLIGLGMTEATQGNPSGSTACFDLLERGPAPPEIREMAAYWRLQSLLNANRWTEALELARQYVSALTATASQGRVSFAVSLIQAGFAGKLPDPQLAQQLGALGVTALIKLRQLGALRQLIAKYNVPVEKQSGFYLLWFAGQQRLEQAQTSQRDEDYAAARDSLAAALSAADAQSDPPSAAQCRYQLAWCQYQLSAFADAAQSYETARDGFRRTDAKSAGDAAWMAFVCYQSLAKTQRQYVGRAIQVLTDLKREFPNHPQAQRADFFIGKLQQAELPPEEMIGKLKAVAPGTPDYVLSRFEICQLSHERWRNSSPAEKRRWAERTTEAADEYQRVAADGADPARQLRASLYAAEVALSGEPPDDAAAQRYLDSARAWVEAAESPSLAAEYHYRRLRLAGHRGDAAERQQHAAWIAEHGVGTAFEIPALVIVAQVLEKGLADPQASPSVLREGYDTYQRLVAHYGETPDALRAQKNAQVAASRWAQCAERLSEFETAGRLLSNLLEAFPREPAYLRRAGLVAWQLKNYATALEHWRTLAAGLPKESEGWFEAKYYQLACLIHVDEAQARTALQQFEILYPQLGPPAWRGRFAELKRELDKSTG
ncbi:MAG: tetratricopeptide repeat protein [Pirellulaceae bacterium]